MLNEYHKQLTDSTLNLESTSIKLRQPHIIKLTNYNEVVTTHLRLTQPKMGSQKKVLHNS